ncbi:hypothetical protein ACAX43_00515 [Paraburkholderia sp. IW21]|uniref:hypothetical protein n=1 Tax=Paraburkholderia sp. IW21 TaxID=3242488 RepID=UPI003520F37C
MFALASLPTFCLPLALSEFQFRKRHYRLIRIHHGVHCRRTDHDLHFGLDTQARRSKGQRYVSQSAVN